MTVVLVSAKGVAMLDTILRPPKEGRKHLSALCKCRAGVGRRSDAVVEFKAE